MTAIKPFLENNVSDNKTFSPSSAAEIDRALAVLTAHKDTWARMDIPGRIALLDQIKQDLPKVEQRWIAACMAAKGAISETMAEGEEWYSLTVTYRNIRFLRKALQDMLRFGKPKIPGKVSTRSNGQVVAQVVPYDWKDKLALPGIRAEVWMDPSVSLQNGGIPQASFYHSQNRKGQVCVVLGAGNIAG
jgi:acyl-CoA reductase-like NAD-dependent aldehyde dehydrogenase